MKPEHISVSSFNNICRACLLTKEVVSVFEVCAGGVSVHDMLEKYTSIRIEKGLLPSKMCELCISLLCQSYNFFEMCLYSEKTLGKVLESSKSVQVVQEADGQTVTENIFIDIQNTDGTDPLSTNIISSDHDYHSKTVNSNESINLNNTIENSDLNFNEILSDVESINSDTGGVEEENEINLKDSTINCETDDSSQKVTKKEFEKTDCPICDTRFINRRMFFSHIYSHFDKHFTEDRWYCRMCDLKFLSLNKWREHMQSEEHQHNTICFNCDEEFTDPKFFKSHIATCRRPRSCNVCNIDFCSIETLKGHRETEEHKRNVPKYSELMKESDIKYKQKSFVNYNSSCFVCDEPFEKFDEALTHLNEKHLNEKRCIICGRQFMFNHNLFFHFNKHNKDGMNCLDCRLGLKTKQEYQKHLGTAEHNNLKTCDICKKVCKNRSAKNSHMLSHTAEKKFQCNKCGTKFIYFANLRRHIKAHAGKAFLCFICGKGYTTKVQHDRHVTSHDRGPNVRKPRETNRKRCSRKPTHICELCGMKFIQRLQLDIHRNTVHNKTTEYTCRFCKVTFPTYIERLNHQNVHKKLSCQYCDKMFIFNSTLKLHIDVEHLQKQAEQCDICGEIFKTKSLLGIHMLMHTGEKPYTCDVCNKSFRQSAHLRTHMLMHFNIRPHKCTYCDKAFMQKCLLDSHVRIHTGEKPFKCSLCGKAFYDKWVKRKHERRRTCITTVQKESDQSTDVLFEDLNDDENIEYVIYEENDTSS